MALHRKKRAGDKAEVPMSAMIDVVFLLLIYFIVTHKEQIAEAHLAVNLPSPNAAATSDVKPRLLELEVHPGKVLIQGAVRSPEEIEATLTRMGELDPEQTVIVKTSVMARTGELVEVLDICRGAGLSKLNVMTLE